MSFEVTKLYKVKIQVSNELDKYYALKSIYDESIQKKNKRKCIHCQKAFMTSLVFQMKERNLISVCPTEGCASNMVIPIETCTMYNDFYQESKQSYEDTVDTILSTKFKILFGYSHEQDSDIGKLKELYKTNHEHYTQCITDYKDIVYPKQITMSGLEQRRDDLIEQLKNPDGDREKIYNELRPILCEIRKLKYISEIPGSNRVLYKPYSIADLQHCSASSIVTLNEDDREELLRQSVIVPKEKEKSKENSKEKLKKIEKDLVHSVSENMGQPGKVYLASMNLRGEWAPAPAGAIKVNVTSAQGLSSKNRRDFSPMTPIEGGYKGFYNFEAFWQSGKVFEGIEEKDVKKYWHSIKEAKRRYPNSKDKKVLYAHFEDDPEHYDYVASRKKIYVPLYFDLMKDKEMAQFWKKEVELGKDIVVYDFDGPRLEGGKVTCEEVTPEFVREKINDPKFPFGHGYIVSAWLKGITPDEYI